MESIDMDIDYNLLMDLAKKASNNSYSPYSNFAVGSSVLGRSGSVYLGCNVENSSYGLTNCAERTAIFKAISEGEKEIVAVAIYSPNKAECYPCGACRQVMYEFQGEEEVVVVTEGADHELVVKNLSEFLPFGFKINN